MSLLSKQTKFGEKTNVEYKWGGDIRKKILSFFFQLIRDEKLTDLENQLYTMLLEIKGDPYGYKEELITLYKILCHTRDIRCGRGERDLSYMQLYIWFYFDVDLAYFALQQFVWGENYGSWQDIKKFCLYIKQKTKNENHPFIAYACNLMVIQIKHDLTKMQQNEYISQAGKWAPRENSRRYRWLYRKLATLMYPEFIKTAKNTSTKQAALRKAKTFFRKDLSSINRYLGTIENIMCNSSWANICPSYITSHALYKYKLALQNKTKANTIRRNTADRHICAGYLQHYIEKTTLKYSTISLETLVRGADTYITKHDKEIINKLWNTQKPLYNFKQNLLAIVDLSSSMERNHSNPLYTAIALGIRASELSVGAFQNRLFVFSARPVWLCFNDEMTFVDKVQMILSVSRGLNSNFKGVLEALMKAFTETNTDKDIIKGLDLCLISDMQIDQFSKHTLYTLSENIKKMFIKNGFKSVPRIILWNMRKTSGFPARMDDGDTILLSGSTSKMFILLKPPPRVAICQKRWGFKCQPSWRILRKCINRRRYSILSNKIELVKYNKHNYYT